MLDWPLLSTAGLSGKPPEDQRGEGEGGHSNRRTGSANLPSRHPLLSFSLSLSFFLSVFSPHSYAPVSFLTNTSSHCQHLSDFALLKSPFPPLVSSSLSVFALSSSSLPTSNSRGPAGAPLLPDDSTTPSLYQGRAPPLPYVTRPWSQTNLTPPVRDALYVYWQDVFFFFFLCMDRCRYCTKSSFKRDACHFKITNLSNMLFIV